ncbi:MAG: carboxypeptidase-like regulatory domain-containing protein, partial [Calditrichaeota bacterium]|nr:carboxypeptidase-like regulatory domain-containing protein [Calditrichota bacterium]
WIADDIEDEYEIKDRVIEMYDEGLEYLFIIGDAYRSNDDKIPMHFWDAYDPGFQDELNTASYSDTWFICLDPPDVDDEDHLIEDHLPELSVGRLVYDRDDVDELEIQIAKILNYLNWELEQNNDGEWFSRAILLAHKDSYDNYSYVRCKRVIEEREYEMQSPEFVTFYGNNGNATNENVINAINEDGFIIFNYRGHGSNTSWSGWSNRRENWDTSEVDQLENIDSPFILVSNACWTGNIATRGGDCLTESFQKHEAGGSMCAHGSIISTYTESNNFFDSTLFKGWFDEGINDIGYAEIWAMTEMVNHWADAWYASFGRMNLRTYAWQGDPALEIRLEPPQEMEIGIPILVNLGTDRIYASVSINMEPFEGATICARGNDDDIYVVGSSDEDGRLILEFDPPLEEAVILSWTAYHRLGLPVSGEIMVLDSVGSIEGTITSLATEELIADALVQITAFDLETQTNDEGYYTFRNIPASEHVLEVSAFGYLNETADVLIIEDSTHIVNFALRNSVFYVDSLEVNQHLEENESQQRDFVFTNSGNGELIWSAALEYNQEFEEFEVIKELPLLEATGDTKINGVEYINGEFFISGSNNNQFPNYIYVVDTSGEMTHRYNQPDGCGGVGLQDLTYDGENLYGGCRESIFVIDLEAVYIRSFEGPYNPNSSLTFDDENNLWVGSSNQALLKIDTDGNVLDTIPNELAIRALAWFPNAEDGYKLMLYVRDSEINQVLLYRANPETHDVRFVTSLTDFDDNMITGQGLTVSMNYNPFGWTLLGMVIDGDERIIRAWHLSDNNDWLRFVQDSGTVEPEEDGLITFIFTAPDNSDGMSFRATLQIETNSPEPLIELEILLEVGTVSVIEERDILPPTIFALGRAYPNPFNARTVIPVELPVNGLLEASIYDITGRKIIELTSGKYTAGRHELVFSADELASGVYLLRVDYNGSFAVQKVVLLR